MIVNIAMSITSHTNVVLDELINHCMMQKGHASVRYI